ncbi:hypothetical protein ACIBCT_33755 [Streptosporangium sp. NPDC050855]|uniref:hypothetical protein n=1 Tax=Streptosporangium sp. NPDC050855 TaxID=3366194 RepID=UPI0037BC59CF
MTGLHPPRRVAQYRARGWWTDETMDGIFTARVAATPGRLAVVDPPDKQDLMDAAPPDLARARRGGHAAGGRAAAARPGRG